MQKRLRISEIENESNTQMKDDESWLKKQDPGETNLDEAK